MKINNKKGISMIETIVAIFIAALIVAGSVATFSKFFSFYRVDRSMQKSMEEVQNVINLMAKTIRTSTVVNPDGGANFDISRIKIFDYSQKNCIQYTIGGGVYASSVPIYDSSCPNCKTDSGKEEYCDNSVNLGSGNSMLSPGVSVRDGKFAAHLPPARAVGIVTIALEVCADSGCTGGKEQPTRIQTSVSLSKYRECSPYSARADCL